jgi:hypothetical protein
VTLDILDGQGSLLRRIAEETAERGAHRQIWDLRHVAPPSDSDSPWRTPPGRFVPAGEYQVRLTVGDQVHTERLAVRPDPAVQVGQRERRDREATLGLQARLVTAAYHAGKAVDAAVEQTAALLAQLGETSPDTPLRAQGQAAADEAKRLHLALRGEELGIAQQETYLPLADLTLRLYMTTESWSGAPSPEQRELTRLAHRDLDTLLAELRPFLADTLPALRASADAAGVAWPADTLPAPLPGDLIPDYR